MFIAAYALPFFAIEWGFQHLNSREQEGGGGTENATVRFLQMSQS